ncbi:MAG: ERCC4 domain-containing protein [Candidatus Bathyarchaeia archaeon]
MVGSGTLIPYIRGDNLDQPVIIVDSREASVASKIINGLKNLGAIIRIETLDKGDYVISDECVFERKTVQDFVNTLTHRDLFEQVFLLKEVYEKPFLLIEGYFPLIYKFSKISPSAIWGAIFALAKNGINVINTINYRETVILLYTSAKQEQFKEKREPAVHPVKKLETIADAQVFFLASLPRIGRERAINLLKVYKTPLNALMNVDRWPKDVYGLGPKTSEMVKEVLHTTYTGEDKNNTKNNRRIPDFVNP